MTAEARQFPAVRLNSVVSFDPVPAGTRLTERIEIIAPRPLLALTVRQAVAAHGDVGRHPAALRRRIAGQPAVLPLSTLYTAPCTVAASSLARKAITLATSTGAIIPRGAAMRMIRL